MWQSGGEPQSAFFGRLVMMSGRKKEVDIAYLHGGKNTSFCPEWYMLGTEVRV